MSRKRVKPLRYSALVLGLMALAGCTQWRYDLGTPLSAEQLPEASAGLTLGAVLQRLGPPHRVSATADGYVLAWEFWKIREDTIGLSLGALGADLLSVDWGKARVSSDFLLAFFDRHHRLTASAFTQWQGDAGGGRAVQPLLGLVSLVDVDDLVDYLPQHRWGASLLQPLPKAANRDSRPDTGQNGIQRRGTPAGVGQQSLE